MTKSGTGGIRTNLKVRLIAILAALFVSQTAFADSTGTMIFTVDPRSTLGAPDGPRIVVQLEWKAWTLLGEPVYDSVARWGLLENSLIMDGEVVKNIPESVTANIKIVRFETYHQVTVPLGRDGQGIGLGGTTTLRLDPGAMAEPAPPRKVNQRGTNVGAESFHTPTSTNWDELFLEFQPLLVGRYADDLNHALRAPQYLHADQAKETFQVGFSLENPGIVLVEFDLSAVRNWLEGKELKEDQTKSPSKRRSNEAISDTSEEDFWNGGVSVEGGIHNRASDADFWRGADVGKGADKDFQEGEFWNGSIKPLSSEDFEIKSMDGKQGVVSREGHILIPFREWEIKSYKAGMAMVSKRVGQQTNRCRIDGMEHLGGWDYSVSLFEEGIANVDGNWIVSPNKVAVGKLWKDNGYLTLTARSGVLTRAEEERKKERERIISEQKQECRAKMDHELQNALIQAREDGYVIE